MTAASCNAMAMGLVAAQALLSYGVAATAHCRPRLLAALSTWPVVVAGIALLLLGVLTIRGPAPILSWLSFAVGGAVLAAQLSRVSPEKFRRGTLQSGCLLLLAAALAPFLNYYAGLAPQLLGSTAALLVLLVFYIFWPCAALEGFLSAAGSVLFAVWTVHDVATVPCESPLVKSTAIFLDILNLLNFSAR